MSATTAVAQPAAATAAPPVTTALSPRQPRYIADVIALHDRVSVAGLVDAVDPLYLARRPGGLTVLTVRDSQLPERYRLMVNGFRLAQYLRFRFASDRLTYERALFAEPHTEPHGDEIHVIGIDEPTGKIARYVSFVGSTDVAPLAIDDPRRAAFPCEVAHGTNLFSHVPVDGPLRTDEVWEIKRLMQSAVEETTSAGHRLQASLQLMLGFYTTLILLDPVPRYFVGDGEEGVAIQRLQRSLRDITVIEGTQPRLSDQDLFAPLYTTRDVVKPFVARVPGTEELSGLVERLGAALANRDPIAGFRELTGSNAAGAAGIRRVHLGRAA